MTKLLEFNPTSRQHIAWALQNFRQARFTKVTDTGKPKVDEATLSEMRDIALQQGNEMLQEECDMFIRLLTLQKWMGQLSEGANSWFNTIEQDGCIHHSCTLATQTGRNAHRGPNLGQVVSAPWARQLFVPHPGMIMVGADLEGLELRCLGHYLSAYDEGAFADVVLNGDIHQQNADRVGCTRKEVKTITYAFIYGAGDQKLGHSLNPALSDAQKKSLGGDYVASSLMLSQDWSHLLMQSNSKLGVAVVSGALMGVLFSAELSMPLSTTCSNLPVQLFPNDGWWSPRTCSMELA